MCVHIHACMSVYFVHTDACQRMCVCEVCVRVWCVCVCGVYEHVVCVCMYVVCAHMCIHMRVCGVWCIHMHVWMK